jgi:hypothetical protein
VGAAHPHQTGPTSVVPCPSLAQVAAKKLDRRLEGLGALPLLERGLGDDQHPSGYEAALDSWLPRLWAQLRTVHPLPPGVPQVGFPGMCRAGREVDRRRERRWRKRRRAVVTLCR